MHTFLRSLSAVAILFAAGITGAGAAEPIIGTWNLNLSKSQFSPGAAPQSMKRVYNPTGDSYELKWTGVGTDGKGFFRHTVFKLDGKDYPYTGQDDIDTMAVTRVNASGEPITTTAVYDKL